ncbi:MAG: endonuclease/exonuclease/phosphatase family protein [Bacteroidales bacterium]|nr:endonuclease/exonuclease/phosphatase family protein [Bacteroidales bacterium]
MKKILYTMIVCAAVSACCADKSGKNDLRVMSFNIRMSYTDTLDGENCWNNRRDAAMRLINETAPDLIGCQEVLPHQGVFMKEKLGADYESYGLGRESGFEDGEGEAMRIFVKKGRFKILDKGTFWLSETPDEVSVGWDACCHRTVTWAKIRDRKARRELYFFNTHFDHCGNWAREEEGKLIVRKIKEITGIEDITNGDVPVFLTGDFNSNVNSPALDPVMGIMNNARLAAPISDESTTSNSFGKDGPNHVNIIDHIFFAGVDPVLYRVENGDWGVKYISDHYPIIGEFQYK